MDLKEVQAIAERANELDKLARVSKIICSLPEGISAARDYLWVGKEAEAANMLTQTSSALVALTAIVTEVQTEIEKRIASNA